MTQRFIPLLGFVLVLATTGLGAAESSGNSNGKNALPAERQSVTKHSVQVDGETIRYTATAGTLFLKGEDGEPRASIFYVAYTKDGTDDAAERPVTLTFNGGPGSSSVWLHLGAFGPRRVDFPDAEQPEPPPYDLVDNAHTLLGETDLVFIDPVGTGFSRPLGDADAEAFLGVEEDVKAVYEFIRRWTTENERWNSPRFLAGESYGTTRAAKLVNHAQDQGMFFNGVVLVSSIMNFQTARFETGNDLPYLLFLPTYAATAYYHDVLPERPDDLEGFLDQARTFALDEYGPALLKGDGLQGEERDRIVDGLHRFTGLDQEFIRQANLRVSISRFTKELLRDGRRTVGRLDSRYHGIDSDAAGERFEHDPSYTAILGPYTAALNDYVRDELGFEEDRNYEILSGEVNRNWNWQVQGRSGYINVAEDLREAMSTNTHLEVLVANGYYDLATPFFATEYTIDHLGLEPGLRDHVELTYYPAGHMMYVHRPSLEKLKQDVAGFIQRATED
jgi:carboxypeptidase C (cathepsin A)